MFVNPKQIVSALAITPGLKVADLGAGIGAFSIPIAERVGEAGKVYAVEVQSNIAQRLKEETKRKHLDNVEVIVGNIETLRGTKIADKIVDLVVLANVLFQVEDKDGCLSEIARILKPNGKVLILDWTDSFLGMGPRPEYIISPEKARNLFESKGYKFVDKVSAGEHHYGINFTYEK